MASSEKGKKLSDLLVIELRNNLKQRLLDHIGTKAILLERLELALISEGKDPEKYIFSMDNPTDTKIENPKDKEQLNESNSLNLNKNTDQSENDSSVLSIDASISETNLDDSPKENPDIANDSTKVEIPSEEMEMTDKNDDDNMELERPVSDSFVLMIDELISETFLEDTQNEAVNFVDPNESSDDKLDTAEDDKEQISTNYIAEEEDPLKIDLLNVELEEEKKNSDSVKADETSKLENMKETLCQKELFVVVTREDFIENKGRTISDKAHANEIEQVFQPLIKIKQEIIVLSDDDDCKDEENLKMKEYIKEELLDINTVKNDNTVLEKPIPNSENEEIKTDAMEHEEIVPSVDSSTTELSSGKENISKTKKYIGNLKIDNLISSVKAQDLRRLLCEHAKVLEVKVFHDNKKTFCHAFARVEAKDINEIIEKLNNIEYKGTVISVTKVDGKKSASADKELERNRFMKSLPQKKKLELEEKVESREVDRNLWVTNLLQNTKAQDIKQLLSQHAKVIGVKVVKSSSDPSKNCYGYVTLESKNDVDLCIQKLDKITFNGRVIRLSATKKAPVLDSVTDKNVKKISPEMEVKGSNVSIKTSDKKKTPEKSTKKTTDPKKEDDKRNDYKKGTYEKVRSDRDRHQREKIRLRFEEERMRQDLEHAREISRRQREEARQLIREREKLRKEREYLERQRIEMMRLERERQRIEREKIEKEKEELRRQQQRLEEVRRAEKRTASSSSLTPSKRMSYGDVSPKCDVKSKKSESHDFPKHVDEFSISAKRSTDFSKELDDPVFPKRLSDYSKRADDYPKRTEDYSKRTTDYHKRSDDYSKRTDAYSRRSDEFSKRASDDFPKRFDHFAKQDNVFGKEDYHKRSEFPNRSSADYKREDRPIGVDFKRDYSGDSSHSSLGTSRYKFDSTYHQDRDKLLRTSSRKDPNTAKDHIEITNTEAYRSISRDVRERERKAAIDYNYKNESRIPLLKDTPRYKDDNANLWQSNAAAVKTFRDVDNPNISKETWFRKWDGQWNTGTSGEYSGENYNSGPACPPPPGINNYPLNSHFGSNYRKY